MTPNWLMLIGGIIWLVGELWGVVRNHKVRHHDTTSEWVWALEARWHWVRIVVALFAVWLGTHLVFGVYW